jgi:hypothetical protein
MLRWVWGIFHSSTRQRTFLVKVKALLELSNANLANPHLSRMMRGEMIAKNTRMLNQIERMLK